MSMLEGTIIENSLKDKSILKRLHIIESWTEDDWILHQVSIEREDALSLQNYLDAGPWYIHFWAKGKDDVLVIFKDKIFDIKYTDRSTWQEALQHGRSIGIPEEQLDFTIEM